MQGPQVHRTEPKATCLKDDVATPPPPPPPPLVKERNASSTGKAERISAQMLSEPLQLLIRVVSRRGPDSTPPTPCHRPPFVSFHLLRALPYALKPSSPSNLSNV